MRHPPCACGEAEEADHHHQPQIHLARQDAGDRRGDEHRQAADEQRLTDHHRIVAADAPEEDRIEVGEAIEAYADDEGKQRAEGEVDVAEGSQVDDRLLGGEDTPEEDHRADGHDDGADEYGLVLQPVIVRALFQHILHAAEEGRHAGKAPPVELAEQLEIGLVEIDQRPGGGRHQNAGHDIDEEQPMP